MDEADELLGMLREAIEPVRAWQETYGSVGAHPSVAVDPALVSSTLAELGVRLGDNYPFHHPRYAGQMLKPPHPVAVVAYTATMLINPNNHALDGGPATAAMEKEVVAGLATMFGFDGHLGHLTSSGTTGNLEALFVARELHPDHGVAYSAEAHYTHARMCHVLGVEGYAVPADATGRMDLDALDHLLREGRVGTVVATLGTTGLGAVDPVEAIVPLARAHGVRVHVDAAYGGFFSLVADDSAAGVASAPVRSRTPRGLCRRGPAQARAPAVRLRRGALRGSVGGAVLRPRLAVHLLHLRRAAPRRDLAGVLTGRRCCRRAVGDPAGAAAHHGRARRRAAPRAARGPPVGGAPRRHRRAGDLPGASARHRLLPPAAADAEPGRRGQRRDHGAGHDRSGPGLPRNLRGHRLGDWLNVGRPSDPMSTAAGSCAACS